MAALGLSQAELKQIVWWYSPHLLSVGICLLFAYGVAFLLAYCGRRGIWRGIVRIDLVLGRNRHTRRDWGRSGTDLPRFDEARTGLHASGITLSGSNHWRLEWQIGIAGRK